MQDTATPLKFDKAFTQEAEKYIEISKKQGRTPSVETFANRIGTDVNSIWAWANKKKKDENGNVTEELARPNFHAVIIKIEELGKIKAEEKQNELNPNQELFCQLYASDYEFFGNGTQSYIKAYGLDKNKKGDYNNAMSASSDLLRNPKILNRINELLEGDGLNDQFVDKQLLFLIKQNVDLSTKIAAIREYNKLKTRIVEKIDHTTKGKELPTPIYGGKSTENI